VSSELWEQVVMRDAHRIWRGSKTEMGFPLWLTLQSRSSAPICVVGYLNPPGSVKCFGGQTVDHVKDDPMMGRRAPSDERHLVACCWGHNAFSPPTKEMRQKLRAWLKTA
jgi:hypothetical protein